MSAVATAEVLEARASVARFGLSLHVQNAALLATAYFAIAGAGHALSPGDDVSGFFWLPAGMLLATLLLATRCEWPALLAGALVGDAAFGLAHDLAPAAIATRYGATAFQALLGATSVGLLLSHPFRATTSRGLLLFLSLTVGCASLAGALVADALTAQVHVPGDLVHDLWTRWGSSAMGMLLLAPHMLAWSGPADPGFDLRSLARKIEAVALLLATVAAVAVVFVFDAGIVSPVRIVLAAPVVWAGMRFGLRGVTTVNLAIAAPVAFFTGAALTMGTPVGSVIGPSQSIIALLSVIGLALALVVQESREQLDELGRSEDRFRAAIEDQTEMIVRWKPDGTRTFVNPAYCRALGAPAASLLGTSFFVAMPEPDRSRILRKVRSLTPAQPVAIDVHQSMRPDGSASWEEWTDRGLFDGSGRLVELQSTGRDITQRRSDEQEIRRLSRLYASLSAVNHAVLTEPDVEGFLAATCRSLVEDGGLLLAAVGRADHDSQRLEVVACEGPARDFLRSIEFTLGDGPSGGGPAATAVEQQSPYLCNDFALDARTAPWREAARRFGIRSSAAFPIRGADRSSAGEASRPWGVLALYAGEVGSFGDRETRLLGEIAGNIRFALDNYAQELSRREIEHRVLDLNSHLERRVAERTREIEAANRELELANRELEAFSASVSHDLRSPLRLIDGFTRSLAREHVGPSDVEGQADVERVRSAARSMEERIGALLRLSRMPRGPLHREPVDLTAMAAETVEVLRREQPARSVLVTIEPGLETSGSPALLRVVLENLIGNAWKFTSRTAGASIEVGRTVRDGEPAFFVRDNGAGFPMTQVDHLFQAFHRLHDDSDFPGTGIGLVTVQRIVQRHGGRIQLHGEPDEGACVYFTIAGGEAGSGNV